MVKETQKPKLSEDDKKMFAKMDKLIDIINKSNYVGDETRRIVAEFEQLRKETEEWILDDIDLSTASTEAVEKHFNKYKDQDVRMLKLLEDLQNVIDQTNE